MKHKSDWFFSVQLQLFDTMLSDGGFWFELLNIHLILNVLKKDRVIVITVLDVGRFSDQIFSFDLIHVFINETAYGVGYKRGRSLFYKHAGDE